ncbi:hypothetical protein [Nocardioides sp. WS12]|uniref:hypothetical protein n=1 Tax=Nocardioides sp. WS12 TaxID=2486272 RepID=UPI0015FC462C|nr:hypothetical protein [Nocardioides sp. WS12]
MTTLYSAYGLRLASEVALPELGAEITTPGPADIEIVLGAAAGPSATATLLPLGLWVDGDRIGVDVPDVGRYVCEGGSRIVVEPVVAVEPGVLKLFLLGTALGALMVQRGHLVLHGNAFRVGDACAVVVGHSGAGKSTLAAEMHRRGHDILSDDVVPIDAHGCALPGWPRLKLWQDALDRLGIDSSSYDRIRGSHAKFHVPIDRPPLGPLPVRWIYVLDKHRGLLTITPLAGAAIFTSLHEHSYRKEILVGAHRQTHLARSAALVATVRPARLDRPRGEDSVVASADAILADITQSQTKKDHHATSR